MLNVVDKDKPIGVADLTKRCGAQESSVYGDYKVDFDFCNRFALLALSMQRKLW